LEAALSTSEATLRSTQEHDGPRLLDLWAHERPGALESVNSISGGFKIR